MITVEFYGIARLRAGVDRLSLPAGPFRGVLERLAAERPMLQGSVIRDSSLLPSFLACLDGERFLTEPDQAIPEGSSLWLLSADVGG